MAGKRRHIPPVILLIAVTFLAVASARPHVSIPLPRLEGTMMLAMDVSSSMGADDVQPSRLEAAKLTAKALVEQRPAGALVGVVAFGQGGLIVQPPTDNGEALNATIDRLTPDHGTSLARGILTALHSITSQQETGSQQSSLGGGKRFHGLIRIRNHRPADRWGKHGVHRSDRSRPDSHRAGREGPHGWNWHTGWNDC